MARGFTSGMLEVASSSFSCGCPEFSLPAVVSAAFSLPVLASPALCGHTLQRPAGVS